MKTCFKKIGDILLSAIVALFIFAIVVKFAPISISNLLLNPLKVVQGLQYEQEKEYKEKTEKSEKNFKAILKNDKEKIFDPKSPFIGNKNAKTEVVVFFDYKCGYCSALTRVISNIMQDDKYQNNVKFIMRDLPILSPASQMLAVAGLKGFKDSPKNFLSIHEALFAVDTNKEAILSRIKLLTGKTIDLSSTEDEQKIIEDNLSIAKKINIQGTPAIIIGDELIAGLISEDKLKQKLDKLI